MTTQNESDRGGPDPAESLDTPGGKPAVLTCPDCGAENIQGTDFCVNCEAPLRAMDIPPDTWSPALGPPGEEVGPFASGDVLRVEPQTTVAEVVRLLQSEGDGCAVVVDGGRVVGVFTERDVLNTVTTDPERVLALPVSEVMTGDPVVLRASDSVLVAINKMGIGGFRHIPLVDEAGALQGMVSGRAILSHIAGMLSDER